jgi:hypothetical protein
MKAQCRGGTLLEDPDERTIIRYLPRLDASLEMSSMTVSCAGMYS